MDNNLPFTSFAQMQEAHAKQPILKSETVIEYAERLTVLATKQADKVTKVGAKVATPNVEVLETV
jgi:hypothetical protein